MLQKIDGTTERFSKLISKVPFYEGKCSNWEFGQGIFIQNLGDQIQFLYVFKSDGVYKSYELTTEAFPA